MSAQSQPKLLPPHEEEAIAALPPHEENEKKKSKLLVPLGIALVVIAAVLVGILLLVHRHTVAKTRAEREHDLAKGPNLTVAKVDVSRTDREISLPGEVRGFNQATLYGKVSGYVGEIRVDRGDRVKRGDLIAIIESPEMQDDVLSAESNVATTKRNWDRYAYSFQQGTSSAVQTDNALNASLQANANLRRARNLLHYTQVRAPFDGIVTARYVDPGALVPAATSATQQAQPVVDIADVDRVRIFLYLGQDAASFVKAGDSAAIYEDERPGLRVPAAVTRVAGALDPRTRTMQCEIDVDNRSWNLIPGTFVHVRLAVSIPPSPVVPDDALVTRDGKPHVAIVDQNNDVHYREVELGSDDGITTRVQSGLSGGEMIGINVPVEIAEGELVQPMAEKSQASPPPAAKKSGSNDPNSGAGRVIQTEGTAPKNQPTEAPTTTPTNEAPAAPSGPGPVEHDPQPNVSADNAPDGGRKSSAK